MFFANKQKEEKPIEFKKYTVIPIDKIDDVNLNVPVERSEFESIILEAGKMDEQAAEANCATVTFFND